MTQQIIENKAVRIGSRIEKFSLLLSILLFSFVSTPKSFANAPQTAQENSVEEAHAPHDNHAAAEHATEHDDAHASDDEAQFDAGEMIMHHIADAHDWHLWDWKGHAVSIPLPVIIYNKERGLTAFLSSKFEHGHASYQGYRLEHGKVVNADPADESSFYDISITKNVTAVFVSVALLLLVFSAVARGYRKRREGAPKGIQSVLEPVILFLRDEVIKPSIGKGYERYMPFLLTVFFFIFFNNLMGLIPIFPFGANVTGNIAVTMVLSLFVLIITLAIANKHYWKHIFLPDVPIWLYPIMIPIEIMGVFIKPFVLMLRLFANIAAGHIIILGFFSLIFIFGQMHIGGGYGAGIFSSAFSLFMSILELLVAFLQAYVFTLLSALYFGMATEEHH